MNKLADVVRFVMDSYYYAFVRFFAGFYFYAYQKKAQRT